MLVPENWTLSTNTNGEWTIYKPSIASDTLAAESDDKVDSIAELVSKGQVIAVYADDTGHDYYLLKV